jgi:hypothetical protein
MPASEVRDTQSAVGDEHLRDHLAQQLEPWVSLTAALTKELLDSGDVAAGVANGRGKLTFELDPGLAERGGKG